MKKPLTNLAILATTMMAPHSLAQDKNDAQNSTVDILPKELSSNPENHFEDCSCGPVEPMRAQTCDELARAIESLEAVPRTLKRQKALNNSVWEYRSPNTEEALFVTLNRPIWRYRADEPLTGTVSYQYYLLDENENLGEIRKVQLETPARLKVSTDLQEDCPKEHTELTLSLQSFLGGLD